MLRIPFERPTEHYDERIIDIDKQICSLIKKRKEVSDNNPGFPPLEYISKWSEEQGLYEGFLMSLFGNMMNEEQYKPMIEPAGFRQHIAILKSVVIGDRFYTLTSMKQYTNASVLTLNIDWDSEPEVESKSHQHSHYELYINDQYDSRMISGGSRSDHASYKYVISPPLPDEISGIQFRFKEYSFPFNKSEASHEIVFET
ncbi:MULTISPECIES: hypothetical protein [unclassified Paenibacillus]|uniref:hypothetical protein n=1 Tax=unclassified Paenibacillus TaxID=185978 RepID=UPI0003E27D79|nr:MULTISPECIES: hypothetical protein [unclassified Paenibacillus]ETT32597.1 hypothetical protein C162_31679 [Paenibacillus sp. FSL R7-269]OMF87265.1 hypothetical protein BK147_28760 [Paenibacillus sp. FSL R7-0337]